MILGSKFSEYLASRIPTTTRLIIISAYVTKTALEWICKIVRYDCQVVIVGRFNPYDFTRGSSDFGAILFAQQKGWEVRMLGTLHAKIYCFDNEEIFVGSANMTNNGLSLLGDGNLEIMTKAEPTGPNLNLIYSVINGAVMIDEGTALKMSMYLQSKSETELLTPDKAQWPQSIVQLREDIFVADFPLESYGKNRHLPFHSLQFVQLDNSCESEQKALFKNSVAYKWLETTISKTQEQSASFGYLSQQLHNALCDQPAPYRKKVKDLLFNLITYVEQLAKDDIKISVPRHSTILTLIPKNHL